MEIISAKLNEKKRYDKRMWYFSIVVRISSSVLLFGVKISRKVFLPTSQPPARKRI